jgi:hypothetical protein
MTDLAMEMQAALWRSIKEARDAAVSRHDAAELDQLNELLARMKAVGMNSHLPTLDGHHD